MNRETLYVRLIKRFYGIEGILDEYRQQQVTRIGSNALMWQTTYILISSILAAFLMGRNAVQVLMAYLIGNIMMTVVTFLYVGIALREVQEVTEKGGRSMKKSVALKTLTNGLIFTVGLFLILTLAEVILFGTSVTRALSEWSTYIHPIEGGLVYTVLMYVYLRVTAKKNEQ